MCRGARASWASARGRPRRRHDASATGVAQGLLRERSSGQRPEKSWVRDRQNGIESLRAAMRAKAHGTSGETPLAAPPPSPPARHPVDVQRLLSRGRVLIAAGDIGGARLVFEHAAADNDPAALFALAETYDPIVLKRWRVFGLKADPEKARFLYDQASFYRMRLAQRRLAVVSQSIEGPAE